MDPTQQVTSSHHQFSLQRLEFYAGVFFVIVGGLIAAVTSPLNIEKGSWLAAYVVLIAGVAQCLLSEQPKFLAIPHQKVNGIWIRFGTWNLGNLLVVIGALSSEPILTDIGGVILIIRLVQAILDTRGSRLPVRVNILRAVYVIIVISIPIGLTLTHLRSL